MKKLLAIASLGILMSCGKTEIVNPTLASEVGTGNVYGKYRVNSDETNLSSGETVYETFPAGAAKLEVTYSESDVNPTNNSEVEIEKVFIVTLAVDGTYSFDVPASGKGTSITVRPLDFVTTRQTTLKAKKSIYGAGSFSLTVRRGGSYPQAIRDYSYENDAE